MEYTVKELMVKWKLSKSGVFKRIKTLDLPVEKREVEVKQKQIIDIITLSE